MLILIKGAGDLATGVAHRLKRCGFDIVMTEISKPTTVRRTIAFSQAVYDGSVEVEGIKAILVNNIKDIKNRLNNNIDYNKLNEYKNNVESIVDIILN